MDVHPGLARPGEWLRQQRVASGLTQEDLAAIDAAHPPPRRKQSLGML